MTAPADRDRDRRARPVVNGCVGVLVAAVLLAALAMLLMSVALTSFYDQGGDDSGPAPTVSG
ncbi:hypothetical protein ABZ618_12390 [Streptomyces roseolus]|uniref:hypothetical protein n=1 Tax=Streptomyces roseolus TaxID=67358 RepID=UPI0033C1197A